MTQTSGEAPALRRPKATVSRSGNGFFSRLSRFFREVIAELSKVIWPTRKELISYTVIVIVFVSVMVALVAGLDAGFAKLVVVVFG